MMVLVDTSVWSLAFRKTKKNDVENKIIGYLSTILLDLKVVMIGPIRQEVLSGISQQPKFDDLRNRLSIFTDWNIKTKDYELAANFYNEGRSKGIQGSHIDYLICAIAVNNNFTILTLDKDFDNYQKFTEIKLIKY